MKSIVFIAIAAAEGLGVASAHTIFQELHVNGVSAGHLKGIRVPDYDGPITNVTSADIICNGGPNPYHLPLPTEIITIPAGATVTTEWHHTLKGADPSDGDDPISPGHLGPVVVYLAKVESALSTAVEGLKWFKIYQDGLDKSGTWGVTRMVGNDGRVELKIPPCVPSGEYLLRAEVIALHAAGVSGGAQFYMECAQINITGGGSAVPKRTVAFPGAYKDTDPGVLINIYYPPVTNYTIPGPEVFSC